MLNQEEPKQIEVDFYLVTDVLETMKLPFTFKFYENEDRIHPYEIYCENGLFEIFISRDKDSLTLEGDWGKTLDFIISFKNKLPESQKLLFFDQGYNNNMVISSITTREDIESVFSYS